MLSKILITCFFGSQHIDEFFLFFLPTFFILFFVSNLRKRKASRSSFCDCPLSPKSCCYCALYRLFRFSTNENSQPKNLHSEQEHFTQVKIVEDNIVVSISNGRISLI